ncbi:unnamed protein product [Dibothriocephalus latus]|uniref:Sas10 C-terminal domain-containing protein n=1 Tax=Dibothriocephalus latus TaxID=60516 RepID=A0A3P7P6L0_DIBLA|nr:unnamed protein product [Dibothriocephalus latus]
MVALDSSSDDEEDEDEEEMDAQSEGSSDSDSGPTEEAADQVPKPKPTQQFPNRPVTKEGILKYRHKRERNPRVHLRHKFRKAQIRYRSRVPEVRKEDTPYAGELRGIRVNLIKSHKFKKPK